MKHDPYEKRQVGKLKKSFIDKMNKVGCTKPDVDYNEDVFEFVKQYDPTQVREFEKKYSTRMKQLDSCEQNKKVFKLL